MTRYVQLIKWNTVKIVYLPIRKVFSIAISVYCYLVVSTQEKILVFGKHE